MGFNFRNNNSIFPARTRTIERGFWKPERGDIGAEVSSRITAATLLVFSYPHLAQTVEFCGKRQSSAVESVSVRNSEKKKKKTVPSFQVISR